MSIQIKERRRRIKKSSEIRYILQYVTTGCISECLKLQICVSVCVCVLSWQSKYEKKRDTWSWNFASFPTLFVLHLLFKRFSFFDNSTQLVFVACVDQNTQNVVNRTKHITNKADFNTYAHIDCSEMATKTFPTHELQIKYWDKWDVWC